MGGVRAEVGSLWGQRSFVAWPQIPEEEVELGGRTSERDPPSQMSPPAQGVSVDRRQFEQAEVRGLRPPTVEADELPTVRNLPKTRRAWNSEHLRVEPELSLVRVWVRRMNTGGKEQICTCRCRPFWPLQHRGGCSQRRWGKFRKPKHRRNSWSSILPPPPLPPPLSGKSCVFRTCQRHTLVPSCHSRTPAGLVRCSVGTGACSQNPNPCVVLT